MRQMITALAAILALTLFLAACGGSIEISTDRQDSDTPAPTQAPTEAPRVAPTSTSTPAPQVEPTPAEKAIADEVSDTPTPTATPQEEPTPAEDTAGEASPDGPIDIAEHLSEKTMRMWDVYNEYDPDALEEFYSEDYWQEEVDEIRSNMQPFKSRGMTFTAEETSPPTEIEPGKWEVRHTARFQGGSVNMVFIYEEFDGDWRFTYAKPE